jgi:hypothetical protein
MFFFTFSSSVPLRIVVSLSKVRKISKDLLDPVTASSVVPTFCVIHCKGPKMVIKRCRNLHRFQKYKRTFLSVKMHRYKAIKKH